MKHNQDQLDQLLGAMSAKQASALPPGFQQNVWREIRQRRESNRNFGLVDFANWLLGAALQPRPVAAALTLALLLGVFGGFSVSAEKPVHRLQFEAFSAHSSGFPLSSIK
jgi:hypothetical protein